MNKPKKLSMPVILRPGISSCCGVGSLCESTKEKGRMDRDFLQEVFPVEEKGQRVWVPIHFDGCNGCGTREWCGLRAV